MEIKCNSGLTMEEREEGELTDEELEDVSDSSISIGSIILRNSDIICRQPFKELSLTSVSDDSSDVSIVNITKLQPEVRNSRLRLSKRKQYESKRNSRYRNKRKQYSSFTDSSSDSDDYIADKRVLRQLRDAVRISSTKKNSNISLRTRLKRMIEPDSKNNSDDELECLRDEALKSKPRSNVTMCNDQNSINDEDLIKLRLVALQSAILKKHENRKRRKLEEDNNNKNPALIIINNNSNNSCNINDNDELLNDIVRDEDKKTVITIEETAVDDNDGNVNEPKETVTDRLSDRNAANINDSDKEKTDVAEGKTSDNTSEIKTDNKISDVLMKTDKENQINQKSVAEDDEDILRAMLLTSISKKIASNNKVIASNNNNNNNKPLATSAPGAPLKTCEPSRNVVTLSSNAPVKRLVINVNSDSESDNSDVKKPTENRFEQKLSSFLREARIKSEQSDISKHLPRSQQLEYRQLKRKLYQLTKPKLLKARRTDNADENKRLTRLTMNSVSRKNLLLTRTKFLNPDARSPKKLTSCRER